MFIGVPSAASLGLAGSITIMLFSPDSVRSLAIKLFETSEHYTLLAIPFFLLSGAFMTTGGVARRLIEAVYAFADGRGASGVYWLTQEYNAPARSLYDTLAHRTSFVVYQR